MTINVSEALDGDTGVIVDITRVVNGSYVDGLWVVSPNTSTKFKAIVSPQQPTAAQLKIVPESLRTQDIMLFISNKPLRILDEKKQEPADVIHWDNANWKVIARANWKIFGHTPVMAARVE